MNACIKLFPASDLAKSQMDSIKRYLKEKDAYSLGNRSSPPASWDAEIYQATEDLRFELITVEEAETRIQAALRGRELYLSRFKKR